jgi:hypothetical protein
VGRPGGKEIYYNGVETHSFFLSSNCDVDKCYINNSIGRIYFYGERLYLVEYKDASRIHVASEVFFHDVRGEVAKLSMDYPVYPGPARYIVSLPAPDEVTDNIKSCMAE